jgi:hypothetical protein
MMNREELLKTHETLCDKSRSLMRKKNADYAGHQGVEPFANFTRVESMGICKTESGMLVRMTDKMSRLSSFMEAGKFEVKDESLEDTILDMINYSVLLYAYVTDKKNSAKNSCCGGKVVDENKGQVQFLREAPKKGNNSNDFIQECIVQDPMDGGYYRNGIPLASGNQSPIDSLRETLGSHSSGRNTR